MKWAAKDTALAIGLAMGAIFMVGLFAYLGYRSLQVGGWF